MRATRMIFRREIAAYLRSPIGYIIAALMLLASGMLFQFFALGNEGKKLSADVLREFFRWQSGATVVGAIALSFRLIAEERQQHTIILLNTSPVRDLEIVLGKFLAAFTFLSGTILLSVYLPLLIELRGKVSFAEIAVGYVGLFLLGGTGLAIGMFATAMTRHQVIALAVSSLITFMVFVLYFAAKGLGDPLKAVVQKLGLWHVHFAGSFMLGTLSLSDVVYYLAMIYFFLLLATKTMEAKRWQ